MARGESLNKRSWKNSPKSRPGSLFLDSTPIKFPKELGVYIFSEKLGGPGNLPFFFRFFPLSTFPCSTKFALGNQWVEHVWNKCCGTDSHLTRSTCSSINVSAFTCDSFQCVEFHPKKMLTAFTTRCVATKEVKLRGLKGAGKDRKKLDAKSFEETRLMSIILTTPPSVLFVSFSFAVTVLSSDDIEEGRKHS